MEWNIEDLTKNRNILINSLEQEDDPNKKYDIETDIDFLNNIILDMIFRNKRTTTFENFILRAQPLYGKINKYEHIFNDFLIKSTIKNCDITVQDEQLFNTPQDMENLLDEFFNKHQADFNSYYIEAKKHSKTNYIKIDRSNIYHISSSKNIYSNCYFNHNIYSMYSLAHEYGHSIAAIIRDNYNSSDMHEVESYFIEFIITDFLKEKFGENYININRTNELKKIIIDIQNYNSLLSYINIYHDNNYPKFRNYNQIIKKITNKKVKVNQLYETLCSVEENYIYPIGYIIALDLYYIYKEDPELGFNLYKNLISFKNESFYQIHDIIQLNKNTEKYIRSLTKS